MQKGEPNLMLEVPEQLIANQFDGKLIAIISGTDIHNYIAIL